MKDSMFKVIIADDEELARKMLITAADWQALNMEIIAEAVSGQDALSIMEEQLPDILFTDIKMPYMDGMELCHIVTRKYPHIKIVITTAFKDFDYAHQCISLGVSHFLLKPILRKQYTFGFHGTADRLLFSGRHPLLHSGNASEIPRFPCR